MLTEGVDVPSLDAVLFLNSRSSTVDITQAVGRAMRKAPGKRKGYIVIPVVVPDDASPQEMLGASDFKTVWEVVRALRSHDSRMEYYVSNASAWIRNAPLRITEYGRDLDTDEYEQSIQQQLQFQLHQEIASKVVDTIGDKRMYPRWGERAADICRQVETRIKHLVTSGGAEGAFEWFLKGIRTSIGDHVTREQAQEMIAQHVVTIPVFDVMLAGSGFAEQNPVSREIERLLETFGELGVSFEEELRPLTRAYQQMTRAFEGAITSAERINILREVYEGFFHAAMSDTVRRVGIVYTPVQIVDFMVRSTVAICQKEFGRSIGSENLHILDPFVGTGTFLARLIEMKDEEGNYLIAPEELDRKYKEELHANEFILLAYYIAAIKIEEAKHSRDLEASDEDVIYDPYLKACLTDTFLSSPQQDSFDYMVKNIRGRREQDSKPMTVILGNPPWSAGLRQAGEGAKKIEYKEVSDRVRETYGAKHRKIKGRGIGKAAGNLFIKAFRWASDRILPNVQRKEHPAIIGFVHPNSLTEGPSLAGVRATLRDDFTDIYVVDLRGNAFKQGDERQREGDNVFGKRTKTPAQITFLVRNPDKSLDDPATLRLIQVPEYLSRTEKFEWLYSLGNITSPNLDLVPVTTQHDWVNLSDGSFERMLPLCKTGKDSSYNVAVHSNALGLATNLDVYVYSYSRISLSQKVQRLIKAYNEVLDYIEDDLWEDDLEAVTGWYGLDTIKWTAKLKTSLRKGERIYFDESRIREVLYRPFTKLWLYEDDRILSSIKTISPMFQEPTMEAVAFTNGSGRGAVDSTIASDTILDLNSVPGGGGGVIARRRS